MRNISKFKGIVDEQKLFEDVRSGSELAFSRFYDTYIDNMFNFGKNLSPDKNLVMDCIHDVFVKFYNRRFELKTIENCKAYIFISLKNKIYDEMRHTTGVAVADIDIVRPQNNDVENCYIQLENDRVLTESIQALLRRLSARQREALILYYIEGRGYEEICGIMRMNYQSVRNLVSRGLFRLRLTTDLDVEMELNDLLERYL